MQFNLQTSDIWCLESNLVEPEVHIIIELTRFARKTMEEASSKKLLTMKYIFYTIYQETNKKENEKEPQNQHG